jgi:hypothetical protein
MFTFMSYVYYWFYILMMNISIAHLDMSPHKKDASKSPTMEASTSGSWQEEEPDTPGAIYDDTIGLIEKVTSLKWGEFFQMVKKQNFPVEAEDEDKLKVFKNI